MTGIAKLSVHAAVTFRFAAAIAALALGTGGAVAAGVEAPKLGDRIVAAQGGPLLPAGDAARLSDTEDAFHAMFLGWRRQDEIGAAETMAVPSAKPINAGTFTSAFGVRADPFRGQAAMHAGIDLAAPQGTAVFATADGVVDCAEWHGGYGNLVELDHGHGLQTRFGHLSRILVHPGQKVRRGDVIALVGSTGRSTGPHLHYEVRIDGQAVNPLPFLQAGDYVVALQQRQAAVAMGGPDDVD